MKSLFIVLFIGFILFGLFLLGVDDYKRQKQCVEKCSPHPGILTRGLGCVCDLTKVVK